MQVTGSIGDWIQLGILVVLLITMYAVYRQYRLQNKLYFAQLLRDRFEMYWNACTPASDKQVESFKDYPEDWIVRDRYEQTYKNDDRMIRRFIVMANTYEYLSFTFSMRKIGIPDVLGEHWLDNWTAKLSKQQVFTDVHDQYRGYYPEFEAFVDELTTGDQG